MSGENFACSDDENIMCFSGMYELMMKNCFFQDYCDGGTLDEKIKDAFRVCRFWYTCILLRGSLGGQYVF